MKIWFALLKKELAETIRSGKLTLLVILFALFGIMNPAFAKLTPWLMEMLSDSMSESGLIVSNIEVNALTSWAQFFKNIPIGLIVFLLIYSSSFTKEYSSGTLLLLLTKGTPRRTVVLSKSAFLLLAWTACYWLCFAVTYGYNAYFWDNGIAANLFPAALFWWLFGCWTVCLTVLFSVLCKGYTGVLLGTGGTVLTAYLIGMLPKINHFSPIMLSASTALLSGEASPNDYLKALAIALPLCALCIAASIPILNKKQL